MIKKPMARNRLNFVSFNVALPVAKAIFLNSLWSGLVDRRTNLKEWLKNDFENGLKKI